MAALPPAPAGVDVGTAEQYAVPAPSQPTPDRLFWEVDSGYYWLVQSLAIGVTVGTDADAATYAILQATDSDLVWLFLATSDQVGQVFNGESGLSLEYSPDVGAAGGAHYSQTVPLPAIWLPPAAQIYFLVSNDTAGSLVLEQVNAGLVVTRAHYSGADGGVPDVPPAPTPILA